MRETIPDQTSNAGPDTQEQPKDWHDWCVEADEEIQSAKLSFWFSRQQFQLSKSESVRHINAAIEALNEAKSLLEGM